MRTDKKAIYNVKFANKEVQISPQDWIIIRVKRYKMEFKTDFGKRTKEFALNRILIARVKFIKKEKKYFKLIVIGLFPELEKMYYYIGLNTRNVDFLSFVPRDIWSDLTNMFGLYWKNGERFYKVMDKLYRSVILAKNNKIYSKLRLKKIEIVKKKDFIDIFESCLQRNATGRLWNFTRLTNVKNCRLYIKNQYNQKVCITFSKLERVYNALSDKVKNRSDFLQIFSILVWYKCYFGYSSYEEDFVDRAFKLYEKMISNVRKRRPDKAFPVYEKIYNFCYRFLNRENYILNSCFSLFLPMISDRVKDEMINKYLFRAWKWNNFDINFLKQFRRRVVKDLNYQKAKYGKFKRFPFHLFSSIKKGDDDIERESLLENYKKLLNTNISRDTRYFNAYKKLVFDFYSRLRERIFNKAKKYDIKSVARVYSYKYGINQRMFEFVIEKYYLNPELSDNDVKRAALLYLKDYIPREEILEVLGVKREFDKIRAIYMSMRNFVDFLDRERIKSENDFLEKKLEYMKFKKDSEVELSNKHSWFGRFYLNEEEVDEFCKLKPNISKNNIALQYWITRVTRDCAYSFLNYLPDFVYFAKNLEEKERNYLTRKTFYGIM